MSLGNDLKRAATQLVNPLVSGIDQTVSPNVDVMLNSEMGLTNNGPTAPAV